MVPNKTTTLKNDHFYPYGQKTNMAARIALRRCKFAFNKVLAMKGDFSYVFKGTNFKYRVRMHQ